MAVSWPIRTLEELQANEGKAIAIGPFGSKMKSSCYVASGVPVIRGTNITDTKELDGDFVYITEQKANELQSCCVFAGDLFFPHRGSIGEIGIVPDNGVVRYMLSSSVMKLTCNLEIADPEFLFYYFRSREGRHEILRFASTVGTPGIGQPLTSLKQMRVPLPPLPEQKAIAGILGALDDKIELNRRMNETLEAMARAIFKSWFVDFDPVRAKLDGRQPPGMDAETAALFPDRFEHRDGQALPQGWPVLPMPDAVEVNPKRTLRKGDVVPYLDMKSMPTAGHRPDEWIEREFKSGTKFVNGDTLLARITPCLENGKTAFVDFLTTGQVGWGSTEYIILRPKPPLPVEFGYYLARSDEFRLHAIQNMTGTSGRQRVPPSCFDQFPLAVPPATIAKRFGEVVQPLMQRITANSEQSKSLADTRDALLPKLLSGEIRVGDAEKTVEGVA